MKKEKIILRTFFYLLIAAMAACVVTAGCLYAHHPVASYCLFGGAGAALLAQLCIALGVTLDGKRKFNGFAQWATSWEVSAAIVLIVALLPLLLILFAAGGIRTRMLDRQADFDK